MSGFVARSQSRGSALGRTGERGFELRRQAESELEGLGELAQPVLRKALDGEPSLVLRKRVERLLDKLSVPTPGQMRNLRGRALGAGRPRVRAAGGRVPG